MYCSLGRNFIQNGIHLLYFAASILSLLFLFHSYRVLLQSRSEEERTKKKSVVSATCVQVNKCIFIEGNRATSMDAYMVRIFLFSFHRSYAYMKQAKSIIPSLKGITFFCGSLHINPLLSKHNRTPP